MMSPADGKTAVRIEFEPGPGHCSPMSWQLFLSEAAKSALKMELYDVIDRYRSKLEG